MAASAVNALILQPGSLAITTIANELALLIGNNLPTPYGDAQVLTVPTIQPTDASPPVDPTFPGFAFEQASFYNYSIDADGNPNIFSQNLIDSVLNRTAGTPILRVGGTSGDFGYYDPSQDYVANRPATKGPPAFQKPWLSIGPSYFEAFKNFPNAKYVFMVPLEHLDLNNTLEWTQQGLDVIGDRLQALEIGNEPNLYPWFTLNKYVASFNQFLDALSKKFPDQLGGKIFQGLDIASALSNPVGLLKAQDAFEAGLNSSGKIKQIGYHLYQRGDNPNAGLPSLQRQVVNHTAIVKAMSGFVADIEYLQKNSPGTPFILSEVGNTLGSLNIKSRNVLASALWNVDYQLHALAMGVTRVNNQQIVWPGFQMWEPVSSGLSPALVRANFYSQPLVADFISTAAGSTGAITRVVEFDMDNDLISAYGAFDNGRLSRIAIVNLLLWVPEDGTRLHAKIDINGLSDDVSEAKVGVLTAPEGAYANDTLTYAGLQWTYESQGLEKQVGPGPYTGTVENGSLHLSIPATSAVLIDLTGDLWTST